MGKSTLLRLIAGLLKPSSGSLSVLDQQPAQRDTGLLAHLCLIPEKTWVPNMRADTYTKLYSPLYPNFDQALFAQCIERFELPYPNNLQDYSYGQQKKFLIAFVVACRPRLFILDEPTNGLDIPSKEQFRQILLETIDDTQSAIISTHQAHDLQGMIDTAMLMDRQQLLTISMEALSSIFSVEKFPVQPDNALFSMQSFNQWMCLVPFIESSQRELDLEMLFSAFHLQKNRFFQHIHEFEKLNTKQKNLAGEHDAN